MKNKTMMALGMVVVASMITTSPVHAAEEEMTGGGSSTAIYTPGSSSGGGGGGDLASWTVDYPIKISLDDSMLDEEGTSKPAHGRDVNFAAFNTGTETPYDGGATVKVSLEGLGDQGNADGSIKMLDESGKDTDGVVMKLWNDTTSGNIATDTETEFAQLKNGSSTAALKEYLSNNENAKSDMTYTQKLTWVFKSEAY